MDVRPAVPAGAVARHALAPGPPGGPGPLRAGRAMRWSPQLQKPEPRRPQPRVRRGPSSCGHSKRIASGFPQISCGTAVRYLKTLSSGTPYFEAFGAQEPIDISTISGASFTMWPSMTYGLY